MTVLKFNTCLLSEGESIINVISLLNPKQLFIINGDEKENFTIEVDFDEFFKKLNQKNRKILGKETLKLHLFSQEMRNNQLN